MPSRAYTSFLLVVAVVALTPVSACVNALSGLYLISTYDAGKNEGQISTVSMPSRAYTSFLRGNGDKGFKKFSKVSMPSRAYTSFLHSSRWADSQLEAARCQCPLGLIPHFYLVTNIAISRL